MNACCTVRVPASGSSKTPVPRRMKSAAGPSASPSTCAAATCSTTSPARTRNGPLAIILDDRAISAPNIHTAIRSNGIITGSFTATQVNDMVDKLNAGSLPARLIEQPISERVIGPSIGADNRDKGIESGVIGLILVVAFMAGYYMIGGMVADAALMLNILFVLAIMAMLRSTFTLPGIAGLVLTIGMAVDANVLIFERIREEQAKGIGLATAIKNGYQRAFSAIFDSNLTTVLTAVILYFVASEDIKGFAIVLILGLSASMFTAIFVTRVILDFMVQKRLIKDKLMMLHIIRTAKVDWMGLRPIMFSISAMLVFGGLTVFLLRGPSKYDIEFTGGTSVQIDVKPEATLTRQNVEDRMVEIGKKAGQPRAGERQRLQRRQPPGPPRKAPSASTMSTKSRLPLRTSCTLRLHPTRTAAPGRPIPSQRRSRRPRSSPGAI